MRMNPQDMPVTRTVDIPMPDKAMDNALSLQFIATRSVGIIPRHLLERSIGVPFDAGAINRIYRFASDLGKSPSNLFYLLMDPEHEIHGFVWVRIDVVQAELCVYGCAVDPEYDDGDWIRRVTRRLYREPFGWSDLKPVIVWLLPRARASVLDELQRMPMPRSEAGDLGDRL